MLHQFTDRAQKVVAFANQEAVRLNHDHIDTEHVLLGIIKEGSGTAAIALKELQIDFGAIRLEIEKLVTVGSNVVPPGKLPQTPGCKKVIEYAIEESRLLGHNYVGTEHLVLGLMRENEGVAAQVLRNAGVNLEQLRQAVHDLLQLDKDVKKSEKWDLYVRGQPAPFTDTMDRVIRFSLEAKNETGDTSGHMLIGLLREKDCIAAKVLAKLGVTEEKVKAELTEREK